MTGFDPADVVAAAGTAEADAVAAAYDYTWLPGKGMMQVLTSLHEFTGLPWCAHGARRVALPRFALRASGPAAPGTRPAVRGRAGGRP